MRTSADQIARDRRQHFNRLGRHLAAYRHALRILEEGRPATLYFMHRHGKSIERTLQPDPATIEHLRETLKAHE